MTQTNQRRIFIGDVHGHYDGLMTLLDAIAPGRDDQIYFLGDLIDRGPRSAQVVKFVQKNSYHCLLGNHEQLLLEAFPNGEVHTPALQAWLYSGGHATVASYKDASVLLRDREWMQTLPLYLDLGDIWLVHAGIEPKLPISEQTAEQFCWIRQPFHSSSQPYFPDKLIIIGHTITMTFPGVSPGEIVQGRGWLDIDTGAYSQRSGWLTGLDITQQLVYQVNVFRNQVRTLPFNKAVKTIEPEKILARC